jgi:hypothetical protein
MQNTASVSLVSTFDEFVHCASSAPAGISSFVNVDPTANTIDVVRMVLVLDNAKPMPIDPAAPGKHSMFVTGKFRDRAVCLGLLR